MKEIDFANRLAMEIDGKPPGPGVITPDIPGEYEEVLATARCLAATDFSPDCRGRDTIRERLCAMVANKAKDHCKHAAPLFHKLCMAAVVAVCFLGALLLFSVLCPQLARAAIERIRAAVRYLPLGPHSDVSFEEMDITEVQEYLARIPPDKRKKMATTRKVAESVCTYRLTQLSLRPLLMLRSDPAKASIARHTTLGQAQTAFPYRLRRPTHLPAGHRLLEVRTFTLIWSLAIMRYDGPGGVIEFAQKHYPAWDRHGRDWHLSMSTSASGRQAAPSPISEVQFAGGTAGWLEMGSESGLIWENPEATYTLAGKGLTLAEAVKIAESVR